MNIPILRVRGDDGKVVDIPAIVGPRGPGSGDMKADVYDPQGKKTDIFKYVDDQVGAVSSFNGRTGAVNPQAGDYTAEMVGAYSKEETNEAIEVAVGAANEAKSDAADARSLAESKATTVTVAVTVGTGWTKEGSCYYKDVDAPGIDATDNPIVDINPGSDNAANVLYSEAMCKVFRITTSENSIRVWATEAIATAFPIQLKVVR